MPTYLRGVIPRQVIIDPSKASASSAPYFLLALGSFRLRWQGCVTKKMERLSPRSVATPLPQLVLAEIVLPHADGPATLHPHLNEHYSLLPPEAVQVPAIGVEVPCPLVNALALW